MGNYLTVAESAGALRSILGEERLRRHGMVQAHGTGTPQNRVTESALLSKVAKAFGVAEWPVAAIKSYVGHSLGAAAGDQLTATLGIWDHGVIPAINTVDALADDVVTDRLAFTLDQRTADELDYALINSKGFGGNNATAALLSPDATLGLLQRHHGEKAIADWRDKLAAVVEMQSDIEAKRVADEWSPSYRFDEGVLTDTDVTVTGSGIQLGERQIELRDDVPDGWRFD